MQVINPPKGNARQVDPKLVKIIRPHSGFSAFPQVRMQVTMEL